MNEKTIVVGVSGASGAVYAKRLLELLAADKRVARVFLIVSSGGMRLLKEELGLAPKNLADLVRRALKLIEGDLAKKNIRLEFSAPDDLPRVLVNENEIVELILNMVLNALESIPDGKRISIALLPVEKGVEKCVRLTVSDEGAGIEPENLSRIFERYFTTKDSGTGLGLAIVDRIVKAHGGKIEVDSTPGVGTTFKIDFPY